MRVKNEISKRTKKVFKDVRKKLLTIDKNVDISYCNFFTFLIMLSLIKENNFKRNFSLKKINLIFAKIKDINSISNQEKFTKIILEYSKKNKLNFNIEDIQFILEVFIYFKKYDLLKDSISDLLLDYSSFEKKCKENVKCINFMKELYELINKKNQECLAWITIVFNYLIRVENE